ncbi:opioid growth factor receptor isoform X1 [Pelobates fuscus]|uniref:opioid growth factor receptor isoform X1 n=1 Tax=Pelobates fuscus TaxID=191477 RepID=UPI002FE4DC24
MAETESDSWEEEEGERPGARRHRGEDISQYYKQERRRRAAKDLRKYRNGYPNSRNLTNYNDNSLFRKLIKGTIWLCMWVPGMAGWRPLAFVAFLRMCLVSFYRCLSPESTQIQDESAMEMPNLAFYRNERSFKPCGEYIDVILEKWKDNYELLEENHSYIQWLFPLREPGMNWKAKPLTVAEIKELKGDKEATRRFVEAYKLMLGFYGIKLVNEDTGEVDLAHNWEDRFENLDYHSHNNLRITRILKCLGELGFEHYQAPLVRFFLKQILCEKQLPNVKSSALDYFMFTVKDKNQRRELVHFAWENYEPQNLFMWGPIEKLKEYKKHNELVSGDESDQQPASENNYQKNFNIAKQEGSKSNEPCEDDGRILTSSLEKPRDNSEKQDLTKEEISCENIKESKQAGDGGLDNNSITKKLNGNPSTGQISRLTRGERDVDKEVTEEVKQDLVCREGEKENQILNNGEAEFSGETGNTVEDNTQYQPKVDPRKRKIDEENQYVPQKADSTSDEELSLEMTQNCNIDSSSPPAEMDDPKSQEAMAKKSKLENSPCKGHISSDGISHTGGDSATNEDLVIPFSNSEPDLPETTNKQHENISENSLHTGDISTDKIFTR